MTDSTVSRLPEPGVILDLDLEERPAEDVKPPFVIKVNGRNIQFADPAELNWQDLAAIRIPADFVHVSLNHEDRKFLLEEDLPSWKFNRLLEAYYLHYDLENKIAKARRQSQLSSI